MNAIITGRFHTRRDAELAIEHLVQQDGVNRSAISVAPLGDDNTVGTKTAGADKVDGHGGAKDRGDAPVEGPVEITVSISEGRGEAICEALTAAKAYGVTIV